MLKICLVLLISVAVLADGFGLNPRIVGGFRVAKNQFPFYAFLSIVQTDGQLQGCGATILSNSWLLTAGHCVADMTNVNVFFGSKHFTNQTKKETILIESDDIFIYPTFNITTIKNDMALLKLKKPIKFNKSVQPVKLSNNCKLYENEIVFAVGYGETYNGSNFAPSLRWAPLKVLPNEQCLGYFKNLKGRRNYVCAGNDNFRSIGLGDSGGALIRKSDKSLVAVSSFIYQKGYTFVRPQVFSIFFNSVTG